MNILAFAIAVKARRYFRSPKVQKMFIDKIHETVLEMMDWDWTDYDLYLKKQNNFPNISEKSRFGCLPIRKKTIRLKYHK